MKIDQKQKDQLLAAAKGMPPAAIAQLKKIMKENFADEDIPYDATHLKAALSVCHIFVPGLPPMYSEMITSSMLILMCLIDEEETGLIRSPIQRP